MTRAGKRRVAKAARGREVATQSAGGLEEVATQSAGGLEEAVPSPGAAADRSMDANQGEAGPGERPQELLGPKLRARGRQKGSGSSDNAVHDAVLPVRSRDGGEKEAGAAAPLNNPDPATLGRGREDGLTALAARDEEPEWREGEAEVKVKGELIEAKEKAEEEAEEDEGEEAESDADKEQEQDESAGELGPSDGLTDYERLRLENIRRNQMLMATLGLQGKAAAVAQALGGASGNSAGPGSRGAKPRGLSRKRRANVVEGVGVKGGDLGVRRSQRLRGGPGTGERRARPGGEARGGGGREDGEGRRRERVLRSWSGTMIPPSCDTSAATNGRVQEKGGPRLRGKGSRGRESRSRGETRRCF